MLSYFTQGQLSSIQKTVISIAGAGGLGSNVAMCLVRSGFKKFEIIDFDVVELSNLNRQYYFLNDVGKPKVEALKEKMLAVNPECEIAIRQVRLDENNLASYFNEADFVIEAFDKPDCKKMLVEHFAGSAKVLVCGNGMAGIKMTELNIIKVHDQLYLVGDQKTSVGPDHPPCAPRVTACAGLMAGVVLELVCQK